MLEYLDKYLCTDLYEKLITVDGALYFPLDDGCVLIVRAFIMCTVLVTCGFILAQFLGEILRRILDCVHEWRHSDG